MAERAGLHVSCTRCITVAWCITVALWVDCSHTITLVVKQRALARSCIPISFPLRPRVRGLQLGQCGQSDGTHG